MVTAFILCYFNYCPLVWHFCGSECSKNLEHMQFRTRKFVHNDFTSSYAELLKVSAMSYLYHQRIRLFASERHQLYNEQGPKQLHSLITVKDYTIGRNQKAIELPLCKTTRYGLNSLRYQDYIRVLSYGIPLAIVLKVH